MEQLTSKLICSFFNSLNPRDFRTTNAEKAVLVYYEQNSRVVLPIELHRGKNELRINCEQRKIWKNNVTKIQKKSHFHLKFRNF